MFMRTFQYSFSIPKELLKYRLLGNHITIHQHDFEVTQEEQSLTIQPTVEDVAEKGTLPITLVELKEEGNKTEMVLTSRMPTIQAGGQIVLMLFSIFLLAASFILLYVGHDPLITYTLCGMSFLVFVYLLIRLQLNYFDYVRKIRTHVKVTGGQITTDVRKQLFKHKVK